MSLTACRPEIPMAAICFIPVIFAVEAREELLRSWTLLLAAVLLHIIAGHVLVYFAACCADGERAATEPWPSKSAD